jgi:hypothetical protein
MKYKEFIFWIKGYLKAVSKDKPLEEVINDVITELEKVSENDLPKADKEAEKNIEDWIKKLPKKTYPPYPFPNVQPTVVMYGCQTSDYKPIDYTIITTSGTYTKKEENDNK